MSAITGELAEPPLDPAQQKKPRLMSVTLGQRRHRQGIKMPPAGTASYYSP